MLAVKTSALQSDRLDSLIALCSSWMTSTATIRAWFMASHCGQSVIGLLDWLGFDHWRLRLSWQADYVAGFECDADLVVDVDLDRWSFGIVAQDCPSCVVLEASIGCSAFAVPVDGFDYLVEGGRLGCGSFGG